MNLLARFSFRTDGFNRCRTFFPLNFNEKLSIFVLMEKSKSNNTGKKISNRSKQSNPNTSWKSKDNSHMSMIKKVYGADYGKKGVEMNGFFRENGYYAIAEFLENGK